MPSDQIRPDWWNEKDEDVHRTLIPYVNHIHRSQNYRSHANLIQLRMYGGMDYTGLYGREYATHSSATHSKFNVINATVNTATSKIGKNKPRILALTEGGSYSQQFRGRRLTKAINGVFHESNLYANMRSGFRNSCIFDLGAVFIFSEAGRIKSESVFPEEFRVDDIEASTGCPRQISRVKAVSREVLIEKFPEHKTRLVATKTADVKDRTGRYAADMVDLIRSWHLPSSPDADDGKTAWAVDNATLAVEPWSRDYFPFVFLRWSELPRGFYGQGHGTLLAGLQYQINELSEIIDEHLQLSVGFMAVEGSSGVNLAHAETNDIMRILQYNGVPPQILTPNPIAQAYFQERENIYRKAFELVGISQLAATAKKPEGLNSGVALREFNDIESERFQDTSLRYEEAFVRAGDIIYDLLEEMYESGGAPSVRLPGKGFMETLDWSKARMDRDDFVLRLVPTSFLPSTPAGKLAMIEEMRAGQLLTREDALELLDYPDLDAARQRSNAMRRNINRKIEKMLDPDEPQYIGPEPFTNHALALKMAHDAYDEASLMGASEESLELLTRFMGENNFYIEQAQLQQQQEQEQAQLQQVQ